MESMMQRQRLGAFPLIMLAIALGFAAAACGSLPQMPQVDHSLTYSLVPYKGGVTVTVADNRLGKHTVWVLLLNPPKGVSRELYRGESGGSGGGWASGSTRGPLAAGTYRYAVYSADGIVRSAMAQYWTPKYRVGQGQVTVP